MRIKISETGSKRFKQTNMNTDFHYNHMQSINVAPRHIHKGIVIQSHTITYTYKIKQR